jgi:hypothetical protein
VNRLSRAPWLIAFAAVLLTLPALRAGFFADDHWQVYVLGGKVFPGYAARPFNLFRFLDGNVAENRAGIEDGILPWWADERAKVGFFRPLASATHVLDHALWGRNAVGYHLSNLLWWAALVAASWVLFRRLADTRRAAVFSFALYALSDGHALVITWVANRNALLAAFFSIVALVGWDVFRRDGKRWGQSLAYFSFALALLSGEAAIAGLAILAAYELFRLPHGERKGPLISASVIPFVALLLGYVAIYKLGGYGTAHSDIYIDPTSRPLAWAWAALARFPALFAGLIWSWPVDLWAFDPSTVTWLVMGGAALTVLAGAVFFRLAKENRLARAMLVGSVLSILPSLSTFPSLRLLLLPTAATSLAIGAYLDQSLPFRPQPMARKWVAGFFWVRGFALAPLLLLGNVLILGQTMEATRQEALSAGWPSDIAQRDAIAISAPHWASVTFAQPMLDFAGRPFPRSMQVLNMSPFPLELSRPTEQSVVLRTRCGQMQSGVFERLMHDQPRGPGYRAETKLFVATVEQANELGPTKVRFDFKRPLDFESFWFHWSGARYEPLKLPEVGGSLSLEGVAQGIGAMRAPVPICP